jgi:hypothetical protein
MRKAAPTAQAEGCGRVLKPTTTGCRRGTLQQERMEQPRSKKITTLIYQELRRLDAMEAAMLKAEKEKVSR